MKDPADHVTADLLPPLFEPGDKVLHIHVNKILTVETDKGGQFVHVEYPGGKSQFVPRGVLVLQPKEPAKTVKGESKVKVPTVTSPERQELKVFMREVSTERQVKQLAKELDLIINISPVASFGMTKMQLMTKINSKLKTGVTMSAVWDMWAGVEK